MLDPSERARATGRIVTRAGRTIPAPVRAQDPRLPVRSAAVTLHAAPVMLGALCVLAIAYRYYSAFVAARALALDDARETPAHRLADGQNFVPTSRWVLFGHHFAAISGSGPLIGPTLAAQFGFAPGFLWLLAGVVLAGAVHDLVILVASTRRDGRSLAELAREELGPWPGIVAMVAILAIVVIAIAGLGIVVVGALAESAWGTFTVGASIPIALLMGLYTYKLRPGRTAVRDSTLGGVALLLVALVVGKWVQDSPGLAEHFRLSRTTITLGIAAYGFVASVLPVWMLLCPRDYLSSYLKIGTIALLVLGVVLVNPRIEAPMFSEWIGGGGPIIKGPLFPFVFVTIACGAISGFHALVSSGTTPKMLSKESDARPIGYGAMLMEGLVGLTALVAATSLPTNDYVAINTDPKVPLVATGGGGPALFRAEDLPAVSATLTAQERAALGLGRDGSGPLTPEALAGREVPLSVALSLGNRTLSAAGYHVDPAAPEPTSLTHDDFARLGVSVTELPDLAASADERIAARTGGGVSLAVGMARIFARVPLLRGLGDLLAYWYHFAIMFEALFILTTIDTGTRVGRFLVQEFLGKLARPLGRSDSVPAGVLATALVVGGWTAFLLTGSVQTIWPMFGIANQLLAVVALAVGTTYILRERGPRPALVTFLPLCFVGATTITAGVQGIARIYLPLARSGDPEKALQGWSSTAFTAVLLGCVAFILAFAIARWARLLRDPGGASGARLAAAE
jgi:carbon starvation protein